MTLKKATEIALAMETAEKNAETLQNADSPEGTTCEQRNPVHKLHLSERGQQSGEKLSGACYRCRQKSHNAPKCPYKEAKCHNCGKVGHLKKVCRKSPRRSRDQNRDKLNMLEEEPSVNTSENPQQEYQLFNLTSSSSAPLKVELTLGGQKHIMEVDTRASVSVISKSTYRHIFQKYKLRKSSIHLTTYGGEPLSVLDEFEIDVCHGEKKARLPSLVIDRDGPSLLGRNWLACFQLDWKAIHTIQHMTLNNLLKKYESVLSPGLGTLKGFEAKIHVNPNVTAHFFKARSVPFSMRELVEKELDNLKSQGIIEPVSFFEWAAPIVPVLKANKASVCICGDFKLTVNKVAKLERYPIPKIKDLFSSLADGKYFTKLDLSQAHLQVCLDEQSKSLVVMNTPKGLFRYNRLSFQLQPFSKG